MSQDGGVRALVRRVLRFELSLARTLLGFRGSLQWRVMLLAGIGVSAILAIFITSSLLAVNDSTDRSLEERSVLAANAASHIDFVITQNLRALEEVAFAEGFDMEDDDPEPEQRALRQAFFTSIFSDGVYLIDRKGRLIWTEPVRPSALGVPVTQHEHVRAALESGRPGVSSLTTGLANGGPAVSVVGPIYNRSGRLVGLVGGDIGLGGAYLREALGSAGLGETGYLQLVDGHGIILASSRPGQVLQESDHQNRLVTLIREGRAVSGTCHDCHEAQGENQRETEVMAFAPTAVAPWGVLVRQSESEALAPARRLKERAVWLGIPIFVLALALAWATARSVTRPVGVLSGAAQKIAAGDLSQAVPDLGEDEIGRLAGDFERMRSQLKASLESLQAWSRQLEERVRERTQELEASRDHLHTVAAENARLYEELKEKDTARRQLLRKVINAQEEERRRIARELHDDTSQALAAVVVGMETAALTSGRGKEQLEQRLADLKSVAVQALDALHDLIYDLRPSILDDLGLVAGLRWYAESRLQPLGVHVRLTTSGKVRRLPPEAETALFRIGQEAVTNVAKHAEAASATVTVGFEARTAFVEVEDDGRGFDVRAAEAAGGEGWGLLGIRERTELFGGSLEVDSRPGAGTRVRATIPIEPETP